jgi:hypothetical protein
MKARQPTYFNWQAYSGDGKAIWGALYEKSYFLKNPIKRIATTLGRAVKASANLCATRKISIWIS